MDDWTSFGNRVRELRLRAGLSTKALGDRIHYSKAQVSRVEQGHSPPTTAFAAACDRVFGTGGELAGAVAVRAVGTRRMSAEPRFDLPAGTRRLIGRDAEVDDLVRHLRLDDRQAKVCVLHGMPGVGKTSIALWVAGTLRDEYPDGRLHLEMQGYHLDHSPVTEDEALDRVLRRLGVPGELVPRGTDDRAALLRQKLANLRVLLVLDSVKNAHQVARLLPPNGRSAVIITSRQPLTALGATLVRHVTALKPGHAEELFRWVAELPPGSDKRGDPKVVGEIARLCHDLPLALCIVASRFRDNPVRRLEDVAARLADQSVRAREFDDGERSIQAVFAASCSTLSDAQQAMLAMVSLHPGPRVDAHAAGALAGIDTRAAEDLLDELIRSGMLERHSHNAYRLHDLMRDHLRRPEVGVLSKAEVSAGRQRLFEHVLLTAAAAADAEANEHRYRIPVGERQTAITGQSFPDAEAAKRWLNLEVDNFLPLLQEMLDHGHDAECWQFAYHLRDYFYATKQWELMVACCTKALDAATRTGNRIALGVTLNSLGLARGQLGDRAEAMALHSRARRAFVEAGDEFGEFSVVGHQSWLAYESGDVTMALELGKTALAFYSAKGSRFHAAIARDLLARCLHRLGRFAEAERNFHDALDEYLAVGMRDGDVAQLLSHLGRTQLALEKVEDAADRFHQAIQRARSGGAQREEAIAFEGASHASAVLGQLVEANAQRAAAIALYEEVGAASDAERLRAESAATTPVRPVVPARPRVEVTARKRLRLLALNTEWSTGECGLSMLNRALCTALAAKDVEVYCSVPFASDDERADAEAAGVRLVHPPPALGPPESALSRPPKLPDGVRPDLVVGHGRRTGEAAMWLVEDHFRDAKLLHFFQVVSDCVNSDGVNSDGAGSDGADHDADGDPVADAERRYQEEFTIACRADLAVGVGPVLHGYLRERLKGAIGREPLRLDPGFDAVGEPVGTPASDAAARVLLVGRLGVREAREQGIDLFARALGHALRQRGPARAEVELVLCGVARRERKQLEDEVRAWSGYPSLRVVSRERAAGARARAEDLRRARVVVLPARAEGFGLPGIEAITAGVPVMISKRSGLGALLDEQRADLAVELTNRVIPVTDDEQVNTLRWSDALAAVLDNPKPAFAAAKALRDELAGRLTWSMAADALLRAARGLLDGH